MDAHPSNILYTAACTHRKSQTGWNGTVRQRGQSILASSVTLKRERFGVNRQIQMVVQTPRGKVLSTAKFWLRGKGEVYSGRVTFSDEEARLKK